MTRVRIVLLVVVVVAAATGAVVTSADAASTPVPSFSRVTSTPESQPYGSNDAGVADLGARGYVQEEYFFTGSASGQPYTTRMLVRRPADPTRFSGIVIAESIRSTATRSMWSLREYFLREGHAYVEIGSNHVAINGRVKPSDPARYERIVMPEIGGGVFGHVMEIIAHGGALLKAAPSPLGPLSARQVILAGCSEQGLIVRQYLRDAHPVYRMPDGSSIFDGYFPACVADWPEQVILVNGAPHRNFTPGAVDVPVVNLTGQQEVEAWPEFGRLFRRPDADGPDDWYRVYEVAGMGHGTAPSSTTCAAGQQPSRFPAHHVSMNALDKLIDWVDKGIAPPKAPPLESASPSGPLLTDAHGNARGGVRSVQVDVPVATFRTGVALCTYEIPFSPAKLASLYKSPGHYVALVNERVDELLAAGWYLEPEADEARADAARTALDWVRSGQFGGGSLRATAQMPSGEGLWFVAADGGVFAVGNARYHGSPAGTPLNRPVVDIAPTPSGNGYWIAAADGGVFAYGDAGFHGSAANLALRAPIIGIEPTPSGQGYRLLAADGGVFAYGDALSSQAA